MLQLFVSLQFMLVDAVDRVRNEDTGATAVEYGIMVAFIAAGIILAVTALRDALIGLFNTVAAAL